MPYKQRGTQKPGSDGLYSVTARVRKGVLDDIDFVAERVGISRMRVLEILINRGLDHLHDQAVSGQMTRSGWWAANDGEPTPSEERSLNGICGDGGW